MYFSISMSKHYRLPVIHLEIVNVKLIKNIKYLDAIIPSFIKTRIDASRQTRKFYMQANLLLLIFSHCSDEVKCSLFQTYCINMYCSQLWFNSTKSSINKLSTSYNSVLC